MNNPQTDHEAPVVDTTVAHPARRYNYWLGGKDNFQADRDSGDAIAKIYPTVRLAAIENRMFLRRAVTFLVREAGIRQFLDVGTGIPSADNTHEVAQRLAPECRVVYVDNDPIVLTHARALLTSKPEGSTAYIDADLRQPQRILGAAELTQTLDMSQPVALMLVAVLHFVTDDDEALRCMRTLVEPLPPGSYVALSHSTPDFLPPHLATLARDAQTSGKYGDLRMRTEGEISRFVDGMELVEPGIVSVSRWRDEEEPQPRPDPAEISVYGLVARKP